jgi:hypothetical protein
MKTNNLLKTLWVTGAFVWAGLAAAQTGAVLIYDDTKPAIKFAAGDLKAALEQKNQFTVATQPPSQLATQTAPVQVIVTTNGAIPGQPAVTGLAKEGYAIRRITNGAITRWWVIGNDAPGAMYAGLDVADSVKIDGNLINVADKQVNPNLAVRGIKFNAALDDRTPSYEDKSTAAQYSTPDMWDIVFWQRFLDQMARSRMNSLSLWNRHPFPSMVKVPEYPKAALNDVQRRTGFLNGGDNDKGPLETVKKMTIDEKIKHWRDVMQYAQDRGVAVSIFTWNIHVFGTEDSGYGFTDSIKDQKTKAYMRASVRSLINTYPLLAGIGVTAGENFDDGTSKDDRVQWTWDTYGQGYKDAMEDPANRGRKVSFMHRYLQVDPKTITSRFSQLPGYNDAESSFGFTFKYSQAHMHSSTKPLFIDGKLSDVPPGKKLAMEVRDDDFYNMRWGDPDFARDYLNNLPDRSKVHGFYMGPDGFMWGREVISKNPQTPRQQIIDKRWYGFMLWGHLAYDPQIPNDRFQALLGARYPEVPSGNLYTGLASVSKIVPLMTRFYWGSLDFKWYPEASMSQDGYSTKGNDSDDGYDSVQGLIDPRYEPMNKSEDGERQLLMSVKDYVNGASADGRLTPVDVAAKLKQYADFGLQNVSGLNPGANNDLKETLGDVRAMAWLGRYYSEKILGAIDLYRYQKSSSNTAALQSAKTHLTNASNHWREYAREWSSQYVPQRAARIYKRVDLVALQAAVDKDIPGGGGGGGGGGGTSSDFDVTELVLVNASNGQRIRTLQASDSLSLGNLGAASISIQAVADRRQGALGVPGQRRQLLHRLEAGGEQHLHHQGHGLFGKRRFGYSRHTQDGDDQRHALALIVSVGSDALRKCDQRSLGWHALIAL